MKKMLAIGAGVIVVAVVALVLLVPKGTSISNGGHEYQASMPGSTIDTKDGIQSYVAGDGILVLSAGPATYDTDCKTNGGLVAGNVDIDGASYPACRPRNDKPVPFMYLVNFKHGSDWHYATVFSTDQSPVELSKAVDLLRTVTVLR